MQLGLSGRIIEESGGRYQMATDEFIAFAAGIGYRGVELRGGQLYLGMPEEELERVAGALRRHDMACVFTTPTFGLDGDEGVARFADYLRYVQAVDAAFVRVSVTEGNIAQVQQAADLANGIGKSLVCQIHTDTMVDSVEAALDAVARVDRDNFGITYEPGNFILLGLDYGPQALKRLGRHLFNVVFQNIRPVPETEGEGVIVYRGKGFRRCLIGDPDGVDIDLMFQGLKEVGYHGFVTPIEPISKDTMDNKELARFIYERFRPYV